MYAIDYNHDMTQPQPITKGETMTEYKTYSVAFEVFDRRNQTRVGKLYQSEVGARMARDEADFLQQTTQPQQFTVRACVGNHSPADFFCGAKVRP